LFLSAAGLFTLVSLSIIKKLKEIGVRKVFGASAANLLRVINGEFFAVLTIAVVLGAASGSWMTRMFMGSIWAYYQSPTLWTILGSVIVIVAVAVVTVGYKILQTVRLNPSTVLRDE
jgi:ABC-type antimicrobial peptide transport system permease subunit